MLHEISESISPASSISSQAVTAPVNGSTVDLAEYDAAMVVFSLGVFAGTSPTATIDIQDSPDGTTWTSVPAASLVGGALPALTPATANQLVKRGYAGFQRYLRAAVTAIAGASASLPASAVVHRRGMKVPVAGTE